jgi:hypothetical protein
MADDAKAEDQTDEHQGKTEQAQQDIKEDEAATAKVEALEDDPPQDLADWPDDKAKYKTFGGDEMYEDGPTTKLGPSGLRHHEDGSVSIEGEKVDNPDDYKGVPIPGGPTDPNTPKASGERDLTEKRQEQDSDEED